jgi:Putative auto-transporter adhesin, head GIN domain
MTSGTIDRHSLLALCVAAATVVATFFASSAGAADSETRTTGPFHAVMFAGSWTVDVKVGGESSVVIEGKKDLIDKVKTEVVDGELRIGLDDNLFSFLGSHDLSGLTAHVTIPELTAFTLNGSGKADIGGLNGGTTKFMLDGSGDIKAKGKLDTVNLVVNGSGTANLSALEAAKASAMVNGSGDAMVDPRETLAASINGSGQVTYVHEGVKVTSVIHGSGMVEKK